MYKGNGGHWRTSSLFYERWYEFKPEHKAAHKPVFSLYKDKPDMINARKTFVALDDPTGYKWAITYLGDWDHWLTLMASPWFREAYEVWLAELNIKQKSEAIARIRALAKDEDNDKQALPANRYIAEQGWEKATRGRPSKLEVAGELKKEVNRLTVEDEDLERIGLTLIKGGKA